MTPTQADQPPSARAHTTTSGLAPANVAPVRVRGWTAIPAGVDSGARTMRPPSTTTTTAVATLAGILFATLTILVGIRWEPLRRLDGQTVRNTAAVLRGHDELIGVARIAGDVLSPAVAVAASLALAAVLFRRGARRLAAWLALTAALTYVVAVLVKVLLARPRPAAALVHEGAASFPSSHATMSLVVTGGFLIVAVLSWPTFRWYARTLSVVVVLLTAADRLLLGVHRPSDVLGGWLLAATMLAATMLSFGVSPLRRKPSRRAQPEGSAPPSVAVVYNPIKLASEADFRDLLATAAEAHGYAEPRWYATTPDDPGHAMTRQALADGADLVVAAGGDGTVRVVCTELGGSGVPLGIVASGTGNLLARNLGLPLEHPESIEVALGGREVAMDLVKVSGDGMPDQRFAVMAGLGLDAAIVDDTGDELKKHVGWVAYAVAAARHLSFPALSIDITVDDAPPRRVRARTVIIGNVGTLTGGVELMPDAEMDDGVMDAVVVSPGNVADWTRVAFRLLTRRTGAEAKLEYLSGRRLTLRVDGDPVPRQLDGDPQPPGRELVCEVEPGKLRVRVS
jgi:diacylglycerol kinase family enzyme/membrane-associated phospholipid phosphatase